VNEFFSWLERSSMGEAVRTTPLVYSSLEIVHILGIALLVGPALAFDLRLLGVGRHLLPLARLGFALAVASGVVMFVSGAVAVGNSGAAPWKLCLLIVAGINIAVFHGGVFRRVDGWDIGVPTPARARISAVVSILVWTGVIAAGRLLAYT
jgi:predicted membrane protein